MMKDHTHGLPTGGVGLEDAADNLAVAEHVEIILIPLAGRARGGCAFEDQRQHAVVTMPATPLPGWPQTIA